MLVSERNVVNKKLRWQGKELMVRQELYRLVPHLKEVPPESYEINHWEEVWTVKTYSKFQNLGRGPKKLETKGPSELCGKSRSTVLVWERERNNSACFLATSFFLLPNQNKIAYQQGSQLRVFELKSPDKLGYTWGKKSWISEEQRRGLNLGKNYFKRGLPQCWKKWIRMVWMWDTHL